ncbi:MAG: hypothetical protein GX843_08615 [Synergistaceae bacterium]|nr:hypothetical protein [Synergistaceae bacterium]
MNSRITRKITALVLSVVLVLSLADASAALFKKGSVNGTNAQNELVNANPGQRFTVRVTSEQPTVVSIIGLPYVGNNKMGQNIVKKSAAGTYHFLEHRAPDKRPANSTYYQYYVSIYTPTGRWVDYTLEINK